MKVGITTYQLVHNLTLKLWSLALTSPTCYLYNATGAFTSCAPMNLTVQSMHSHYICIRLMSGLPKVNLPLNLHPVAAVQNSNVRIE